LSKEKVCSANLSQMTASWSLTIPLKIVPHFGPQKIVFWG
jgi:hypothetical protein